jgi:hypothetical protein
MPSIEAAVAKCRTLHAEGLSEEQMVEFLRKEGLSKVQSIYVICQATGLKPADVKACVHDSPAWADVRERDDEFHDSLIRRADNEESMGQ